jgi:hypothetical protein
MHENSSVCVHGVKKYLANLIWGLVEIQSFDASAAGGISRSI